MVLVAAVAAVAVAGVAGYWWLKRAPDHTSQTGNAATVGKFVIDPVPGQHGIPAQPVREPTAENRVIVDTYLGTIGDKDFKLFIENVDGETVEGYNVTGTNRRPVKGRIVNKWTKPTGLGGSYTVFKLILTEPGDTKWDGEFNIDLWISDIDRHGEGSWRAFNGGLEHTITIKDHRIGSTTAGAQGSTGTATTTSEITSFLDRFRDIDTRELTAADLDALTPSELGILRNYVFARHGRTFAKQKYREYFSQFIWYRPDVNYSDRLLNTVERRNVELIGKREGSRKREELP